MNDTTGLIRRLFPDSGSHLRIGGVSAAALAKKYGTPLYLYDGGVMDERVAALRAAFPPPVSLYYSIKANPNKAVLRRFLALGLGLEVASGGELLQALAAGAAPGRIVFAGPGKTDAELTLAVRRRIAEIHVESALEAKRLSAISRRAGRRTRICLRVNPSSEARGGAIRMGGKSSPFGVDEERLDATLDALEADPGLELRGLHLFPGSQILRHEILAAQYAKAFALTRRAARRLRRPLARLNLGGGLGVPYFPGEPRLDLKALGRAVSGLTAELKRDPLLAGTELALEPGRYLAAEAGVYVARVTDIKVSRGKTFLILDGGMHQHMTAAGLLGSIVRRNYPMALIERLKARPAEPVDVVGPLCVPADALGRDVRLPTANVGDLLGVFLSGAYARSASPLGFLGYPVPPEALAHAGRATLVRRRGAWGESR